MFHQISQHFTKTKWIDINRGCFLMWIDALKCLVSNSNYL